MRIGLRIDVDTFRGTRVGVPNLARLLAAQEIRATFFFSVGPDNMGRHLWRLVRPAFLWKMLRSNAPGLYGWEILRRGTLWPGPLIGPRLADVIGATAGDGHEIGFHAWDHHAWQTWIDSWDGATIRRHLELGLAVLTDILRRPPTCSAAPAWKCTERALEIKQSFPFDFNSDCRGHSVFIPTIPRGGRGAPQLQVPVTLPTYDECVGRDGITGDGYYRRLLSLLDPQRLNVLAIHAEVEGVSRLPDFAWFLDAARAGGFQFVTLGTLAADAIDPPECRLERSWLPGRQGWVSRQAA